jgi:hypothetical protein
MKAVVQSAQGAGHSLRSLLAHATWAGHNFTIKAVQANLKNREQFCKRYLAERPAAHARGIAAEILF